MIAQSVFQRIDAQFLGDPVQHDFPAEDNLRIAIPPHGSRCCRIAVDAIPLKMIIAYVVLELLAHRRHHDGAMGAIGAGVDVDLDMDGL